MSSKLNQWGYQRLIDEDIIALELCAAEFEACNRVLEYEHIQSVLQRSVELEYGTYKRKPGNLP